jgi:hypothetical protein
LGRGRPLLRHSRSGDGGTAQPFCRQLESGSGFSGATRQHPGTLRRQTHGSYPQFKSRLRAMSAGDGSCRNGRLTCTFACLPVSADPAADGL